MHWPVEVRSEVLETLRLGSYFFFPPRPFKRDPQTMFETLLVTENLPASPVPLEAEQHADGRLRPRCGARTVRTASSETLASRCSMNASTPRQPSSRRQPNGTPRGVNDRAPTTWKLPSRSGRDPSSVHRATFSDAFACVGTKHATRAPGVSARRAVRHGASRRRSTLCAPRATDGPQTRSPSAPKTEEET